MFDHRCLNQDNISGLTRCIWTGMTLRPIPTRGIEPAVGPLRRKAHVINFLKGVAMSFSSKLELLSTCARNLLRKPRESLHTLANREPARGADFARQWGATATSQSLKSCPLVSVSYTHL